ncbi:AroM family protein [Raoultibacter phocaeensis]|uniref:AroM family protein n=1 Tax=Raoultibacter phocaeensis TaxID=2479841 RepID=UPI0015D5E173|nr:AroM family protein [Raoultibacter phocaeensis]
MRRAIGAVTIGQAPRTDVTFDIVLLLGEGVELIEAGALDELDAEGIASLAPEDDEPMLASRLRDGRSVVVAERAVMPLVQQALDRTVAQDARAVILLCTATAPSSLACEVPVIHPSMAIAEAVRAQAANGELVAVMVPDQAQVGDIGAHWNQMLGRPVDLYAASPYGPADARIAAAEQIARTGASLIVLDCIGYSVEMGREIERISGARVIVPRVVLAEAARDAL